LLTAAHKTPGFICHRQCRVFCPKAGALLCSQDTIGQILQHKRFSRSLPKGKLQLNGPSGETRLRCRPGMDGNYGIAGALPGEQGSPGALHLDVRFSLYINEKFQNPQKRILEFWSKWRDSNSRHPAPK